MSKRWTMDSLFAPWRMQWVNRERPDDEDDSGCPFCALVEQGDDRASNIVARSEYTFVLLNNMPYNPGHVMVLPYAHTGEFHTLDGRVLVDCMKTTQLVVTALNESLSPGGFNVGFNIGAAGGASITDHLHLHIIPRWESDTSFLPLTANTAVVEEAVDETYERLSDALLETAQVSAAEGNDSVRIDHG